MVSIFTKIHTLNELILERFILERIGRVIAKKSRHTGQGGSSITTFATSESLQERDDIFSNNTLPCLSRRALKSFTGRLILFLPKCVCLKSKTQNLT